MKYLKKFNESEYTLIKKPNKFDLLCRKYILGTYTVDEEGFVNVVGNVVMSYRHLKEIPIKFGTVSGFFDCSSNDLITLKNAPRTVGRYFDCDKNKLTKLEGCPTSSEWLCFSNNELVSLEGCPEEVPTFILDNNRLINLKGGPKRVNGDFQCENNLLTSLEDGPIYVKGIYDISENRLTSLRGLPDDIDKLHCYKNPIFKYWSQSKDDSIEAFLYMDIDTDDGPEICQQKIDYLLGK